MADETCIGIVDDDPSVLLSTSVLLGALGYKTLTYESAEDFLGAESVQSINCLVLDVRMPGMNGLELHERLQGGVFEIPVIFITAHGDIPMAVAAVRAGAVDFIEKPFTPTQLTSAIKHALEYVPPRRNDTSVAQEALQKLKSLTDREREVFDLLVLGETNKAIGRKLGISPRTVDVHRQKLRSKLDAERLADLIRIKQAAE